MRKTLGFFMVLAAIVTCSVGASDLQRDDRETGASSQRQPDKQYPSPNVDILGSFLPSSEPPVTLELTEEHEGRIYRTVFTDRAGFDMRTGARQTLSVVQTYSPEGGIVFAQSMILSEEFNVADTAKGDATMGTNVHRIQAEATPSTAEIIRQLRILIKARKWLQAAKYLSPYFLAKKLSDAVLAPIVKNALQAEGQYCPPKPRWWFAPTWAWYLLGCRGIAYSY